MQPDIHTASLPGNSGPVVLEVLKELLYVFLLLMTQSKINNLNTAELLLEVLMQNFISLL